ncbi:MAG: hypothetical protein OQJ97_06795 [Rhodospirillales bacterium]|nr:hypothetical protein [Rhodospirillales bacterium]
MIKRVFPFLVLLPILSGCYLPARFDAEIEMSRTGFYSLEFQGYMAEIGLYRAIKEKKLTAEEQAKKVEVLERDFTRDTSVKEFSYFGNGHFKVHYLKKGDITRTGMVTFVRRNEKILSISASKKTGIITIRGKYLKKNDKERLIAMGLWMEGEVRVKTDAKVISHNATSVKDGEGKNEKVYTWIIQNPYSPSPKLELYLR